MRNDANRFNIRRQYQALHSAVRHRVSGFGNGTERRLTDVSPPSKYGPPSNSRDQSACRCSQKKDPDGRERIHHDWHPYHLLHAKGTWSRLRQINSGRALRSNVKKRQGLPEVTTKLRGRRQLHDWFECSSSLRLILGAASRQRGWLPTAA